MFCFPCEMANAINIPKTHLIMGLSLPLAVLLGYFVAEPMELGSMAVVVLVLTVLSIPLLMRWYYPLLVVCWNAAINPIVFPGRASLWMLLAFVGLFFALLNRAVDAKARFINVPPLTHSLLLLAAVAVITAMLTGGIGVASLGSSQYGGGKYVTLLSGIAGYFALTSRRIPPNRAKLYVACFFLSGISYAVATVAVMVGPKLDFLMAIFSPMYAMEQMSREGVLNVGMVRLGGLHMLAGAVYCYMLARFGIRGLLDMTRPWRLLVFVVAVGAGLYGGFRSYVAVFGLTFAAMFFLERLHRTRFLGVFLGVGLLGGVIILPQAHKLPIVAQRALSFLPGSFDAFALESAKTTIEWRVEMWKQVWPDVPKHLFRGKGLALDPTELFMADESSHRGDGLQGTIVAGDYHNGPLSILIPFGIYGMIAFLWFIIAGMRYLYRNYKFGDPEYRNVNTLLLASFCGPRLFLLHFLRRAVLRHSYLCRLAGLGGCFEWGRRRRAGAGRNAARWR